MSQICVQASEACSSALFSEAETLLQEFQAFRNGSQPTEGHSRFFDQSAFLNVLREANERRASDVHLSGRGRVAIRVNGELEFLPYDALDPVIAEEIVFDIMPRKEDFDTLRMKRELDFSFVDADDRHYRCNAFYKNGNISLSMRCIDDVIPTLDEIGAPDKLRELIQARQGLVLVCGPTGHGKTTTLAAMVEEMNQTRREHILTLEDPIEHVFESKRCMISQRELNTDTLSFQGSLRAAMRQDPDIIIVGEVRDRETAEAVFNLVATGHLVVTTVHANSAAQTLYRIGRMFAPEERDMVLNQMADALLGIVNQRLVRSTDGGRVALFEMLMANYAVKNSIRNGDVAQITNTIATSAGEDMLTFEHSAGRLITEGKVLHEAVLPYLEREATVEFAV